MRKRIRFACLIVVLLFCVSCSTKEYVGSYVVGEKMYAYLEEYFRNAGASEEEFKSAYPNIKSVQSSFGNWTITLDKNGTGSLLISDAYQDISYKVEGKKLITTYKSTGITQYMGTFNDDYSTLTVDWASKTMDVILEKE